MQEAQDPLQGEGFSGISLPLEVVATTAALPAPQTLEPELNAGARAYSSERRRDTVRLIVASGLLSILGYIVVFATVEATASPAHWQQTKELLQILLPALTGIIGTVIGFYFGTQAGHQAKDD